jgi:ABC-type transporter Mla MlaB component
MARRKTNPDKNVSNRPGRIVLGESLDIDGIARLHTRLVNCAAKKTNININAARVEHIDTASLQALVSFVSMVGINGNSVKWVTPSAALIGAASLAGVDEQLDFNIEPGN